MLIIPALFWGDLIARLEFWAHSLMATVHGMNSTKDNVPFLVVAAFDFDGTISTSDSLRQFLIVSIGWWRFLLALTIASPWLVLCVCGFIDRHTAKERLLRASISGCSVADVERWAAHFVSD